MKKISAFIRNLYRVTIIRTRGVRSHTIINMNEPDTTDLWIRNLIKNDPERPEPEQDIYSNLEKRLISRRNSVTENSFSGFIFLLFNLKNIELKMALISLVLVISMGINPSSSYQVDCRISPFSLADTLIDSSGLHDSLLDSVSESY